MKNQKQITIEEKYSLSISEMSLLLGVGEHTLRSFLKNTQECQDCVLHVGTTVRIKKNKFFDFLDKNEIKM